MLKRGKVAEGTRLYPGAEVYNFSNDVNNINVGSNCHISGLLMVYSYGGFISVGDNCSLSPNSRIISTKRIEIGNRVLIAHNVNIIDNISHPIDAALRHEDFINSYTVGMKEYDLKAAPIVIEDDVWIGYNTSILKGVRIGTGAIIGSGSTVTKDVKPWTVNVGNPLRCIRELEPVQVKKEST
jgi:acetyltransferase-like isoleucine patch superfamily enzyme